MTNTNIAIPRYRLGMIFQQISDPDKFWIILDAKPVGDTWVYGLFNVKITISAITGTYKKERLKGRGPTHHLKQQDVYKKLRLVGGINNMLNFHNKILYGPKQTLRNAPKKAHRS